MNRRQTVIIVILVVLLAGCSGNGSNATPTAEPTNTPSPTVTPTSDLPTTTQLPATPTSSPTSTPAQTSTSTSVPTSSSTATEYVVTVVEVVDGDTMKIRYQNGSRDTIRLLGVDTPEVHVETDPSEFEGIPDTEEGHDWLRDWGHKASEFARTEVGGEEIRIVVDEEADRRGSYGRLLVYVYHDDQLLNLQLLSQGYARMYDSEFSKRSRFRDAEETAQSQNIGLWGFEAATPTTSTSDEESLQVAEIHEDADGNDHENLNGEYIVFENTGESSLDLSGWSVSDEADHIYYFPDGFTLEPGQQVTLYTGSGADTDTELYWGSGRAVWNNGGDTIIVKNDASEVVLERSY